MTSPKTFNEEASVASLELCKELYELSGWDDTKNTWKRLMTHHTLEWKKWFIADWNNKIWSDVGEQSCPAYDSGYLLRQLPSKIYLKTYSGKQTNKYPSVLDLSPRHDWNNKFKQTHWSARYLKTRNQNGYMVAEADTPENALAKLAIELFKQGVL